MSSSLTLRDPGPDAAEKPASIYAHIPFCCSKCPYCSFVSFPQGDPRLHKKYMQAMTQQVKTMARHSWSADRTFQSLYIGGGTPTVVAPQLLCSFIEECLARFQVISSAGGPPEVTVEANPNTINPELLVRLRKAGVNRLSIGVQSFSDDILQAIGRSHSVQNVLDAVECARNAGFDNLSLDLMYGLPGQRLDIWQETLEQALELAPEHLSVYELTVEQGTAFGELEQQDRLNLPHEDETASMFELARQVLATGSYKHYEISNYARPGFQCRHNINYWENGSYLGLGSGGVSCFSGVRLTATENPDDFASWVEQGFLPFTDGEMLSCRARFRETVIMGLRMTEGVSIGQLQDRFGLVPAEYYGATLDRFIQQGLLIEKGGRVQLTDTGLPIANQVLAVLV